MCICHCLLYIIIIIDYEYIDIITDANTVDAMEITTPDTSGAPKVFDSTLDSTTGRILYTTNLVATT